MQHYLHTKRLRGRLSRLGGITAVAVAVPLAIAGCGPQQQLVCSGKPEHTVLVPSTSVSDYNVSLELTPAVAKQVVGRVARSCGRLTVGIQDSRPDANLELHSVKLTPEWQKAYNPKSVTRQLVEKGQAYVQERLLDPLKATKATGGSPFFAAMAKIGQELKAHAWGPATVILVGDGLVVEQSPNGKQMIRFGHKVVARDAVSRFIPLLKDLKGSCVMLIGAGANSKLPGESIRASQQILGETVEKAEIGFVATRSPDLPPRCAPLPRQRSQP
jgi:hypothetical protein